LDGREDLGMRQCGAAPIALCRIEIEAESVAGGDLDRAVGEIAEPELRALQIGENADRPSGLRFDAPDFLEQHTLLVVAAMAEIQPENVHSGLEQRAQPVAAGARRTDGRNDLGAAQAPPGLSGGPFAVARPLAELRCAGGREWRESH
jgi:hypothetical protein